MSDKWKDRELTGLRRMHWIEEQVLVRQDPITGDQLERFGKNPEVIIPDRAVELRRLPEAYGSIESPMLSDTGELAFLTTHKGWFVVAVGERITKIHKVSSGCMVDLGIYYLIDVVEGQPLWVDTHGFLLGDDVGCDPWNFQARWTIKLGDKTLIETKGVEAVLRLRDGRIVYSVRTNEKGVYQIRYFKNSFNEAIFEQEKRPIKRFVETADGTVWCFWLDDHDIWICDSLKNDGAQYLRNTVDAVETSQGIRWIRQIVSHPELGEFRSLQVSSHKALVFSASKRLGEPEYISSYTEFADGQRYAYIGQARHGQQRWVVGGVPQPACNWVSRFFQHPTHGLCYLGLVGHHLLTMQVLPVPEKK